MTSAFTVWASSLVALAYLPATAPLVENHSIGDELRRPLAVCQAMPAGELLANVAGTVVDAGSRQPLAGAVVVNPVTNTRVRTDAGGRFSVAGISAETGNIALRVEMAGYATSVVNVPVGKLNMNVRLQKLEGSGAGAELRSGAAPSSVGPSESRAASLTGIVGGAPTPFAAADLCDEGF